MSHLAGTEQAAANPWANPPELRRRGTENFVVYKNLRNKRTKNEMKSYIDIHSHILPGIDDGAENFETSMQMLGTARVTSAV